MSITDKEIERDLISYLKNGNPVLAKMQSLPLDKSLVELGYIDSFGIVDLVTYLENKWKIKIENEEITKDQFGSINKMVNLVYEKYVK
tara:strand:- start:151 stop:414 length:264 start_codon:yes stop_codon:yes gene_type:complete